MTSIGEMNRSDNIGHHGQKSRKQIMINLVLGLLPFLL